VAEARDKAADIIRRAENEAELERRKAEAGIKQEIVDVSALLATQMLGREVRAEDHRELIDSFIEEIGDGQ
jgi:F-type H+-transporting ATPase subunit b